MSRRGLAGSESVQLPENRARAVEVTAADPDAADTVAYALTGPDAARFGIEEDGAARWLAFLAPPDFERPGSAANTNTYEVTVTASSGVGERALSTASDLVIEVTDAPEPPLFSGDAAFEVAENTTAAGMVQAADPDDGEEVTGFNLGGADADLFGIDTDGALAFLAAPDFERPQGGAGGSNTYRLTVTATGGADALSAARDYAVTVTDALEPPGRPAAPGVTGSTRTGLDVAWRAPANTGPPIQDYDLQYREAGTGDDYEDGPQRVTGTRATVRNLAPDTSYEVRVRANSAEGEGRWSAPATATTGVDAPPAFESALLAAGLALAIPENERAVVAVTATDPDPGDTVTYRLSGANADRFEIADVGGTPWLRFATAPDFEDPRGGAGGDSNTYEVTVAATGGSGVRALTVTADVAVTVTDLDLRPAAPPAPTLVAAAATSLEVRWEAPDNPRSPIVEYIAEIRRLPSGRWERFHDGGTSSTAVIGSLAPGATYEIRVRARNADGAGPWSEPLAAIAGAVPGAPARPTFSDVRPTQMTTHWGPPSHTGGSPILKYEYRVRYVQFDFVIQTNETTGTSVPLFRSLATAANATTQTYGVRVRAWNANGWGPWSVEGRETFVRPAGGRNNRQPRFTRDINTERVSVRSGETAVGDASTASAADPDPEDDTIAYLLSGRDGHLFSISADGMLSFRTAPDFENPADGNRDNVYEFVVNAVGGTGARQLINGKQILVTVTPRNRPPAFTGPDAFSVAENVTEAGRVMAEDPDSGDGVAFALGGADADLFMIANDGTLSFDSPPDFDSPGSAAGTNVYELTVTATGGSGAHALSVERAYTVTVTDANEPVAFLGPETAFSVEENVTAAGSAAAADPDPGDTVSYELGGADAALFDVAADGALSFRSAPDFETPRGGPDDLSNVYQVTVTATGGSGARATTAARDHEVTVTDALEPPAAPAPPAFGTRTGATLAVRWAAPENAGPPIDDYDVQYRAVGGGAFTDAGHDGTGTTATLAGLAPGTAYEVQVRARNDEGAGPWSSSATAPAAANAPPVFDGAGAPIVLDFAENGTAAAGTVTARDPDAGDTMAYELGGPDAVRFDIAADGALSFKSPPDFERPRGSPESAANTNRYEVTVTATGGIGARALTASASVTVRVTDEPEPPSAPAAPSVAAGSARELVVEWQAPANTGPAVADYDLRYRLAGGGTSFIDAPHAGPGTTASIARLLPDTAYEVQVLARSDEGESDWSAAGIGRTAPAAPAVSGVAVRAPANSGTFVLGETVSVEIRFDEPVTVTGAPALTLAIGAVERAAPFVRADGPDRAVFAYTVQAGDHDPDGMAIAADALRLPGGASIRDADGNDADPDLGTHAFRDDPGLKVEARPNAPPAFLGGAAFIVAENVAGAGAVRAADPDAADRVTGYALGGVDADLFEIAGNGALAFVDAPNFEDPQGGADDDANVYELTVTAASGEGLRARSAERDYTVRVTDVGDERPGAPAAPAFGVRTATTLEVEWTAPDNPGPPISDYDVQHREAGAVGAFTDANHDGPGTTATLAGLSPGVAYEVQVRAGNLDGKGPWSALATASTVANEAPAFSLDIAPSHGVELAENATQVADVSATDPDAGDAVTWELTGADADVFEIAEAGGQAWLVFADAPDFERPRGIERSPTNTNAYAVTVTAAGGDGGRRLTVSADVTVTVTDVDEPPAFSGPDAFSMEENETLAGAVVAADPDAGAVVAWDLTGPDEARFRLVDIPGGQVGLQNLQAFDFEDPQGGANGDSNTYEVTVAATGGDGLRARTVTQDVRVRVTDVDERPSAPAAPTFGTATNASLEVFWQPRDNAGRPPIEGYDLQYRERNIGSFLDGPQDVADTRATLAGLAPDTEYEVRVRAGSDEGESAWSAAARASTGADSAPVFSGPAAFIVAENVARAGPVTAADPDASDAITGYATGGPDGALFEVRDENGTNVLHFLSAPDFETPLGGTADDSNTYEVTVTATGGDGARGKDAARDYRVTVTDSREPPAAPAAPALTAGSTALTAQWAAPANTGPAIEGYDLRYRETGPGAAWTAGPQDVTATGAEIAGLVPETAYEVQVRAENDEGAGPWSASATAATAGNRPPAFVVGEISPGFAATLAENVRRVIAVIAADPDAGDTVSYALSGPDESLFETETDGVTVWLAFRDPPDFENPRCGAGGGSNTCRVTVAATGGIGERAMTVTADATVTVVDEAEPPVFTGDAAFEAPENSRPAGTVTAEDQDAGERLTGFALGGPDAGLFEITDAGVLSFVDAPDFERPRGMPVSQTNTNVYALTVTATGGTGASVTSASRDYTVTVTNVIERPDRPAPPTLVRATATSLEFEWRAPDRAGGPPVGDYDVQYRRADMPDMTPVPQGQGGATRTVIMNSEDTPLEPNTAYQVRVRVDNGEGDLPGQRSDEGESEWSDWSLPAVTTANEPPVLSDGFATIDENLRSVARVSATDTNAQDSVTYGLGGPDADLFEFQDVNGTNTLFFKSAPDFEDPRDVGGDAVGDNVYVVIVEVASGSGARRLTATAEIEVVVRDVDEPPQFSGSEEFEVAENSTDAGTVQASDPDAGEGVTFEVQGGADEALFEIAADGTLSFKSAPDFERPRGMPESATNANVYEVTVRVESTDPFNPSPVDRAYRVTVTDADDEAPDAPAAPAVAAVSGTSLEVTWAAPANAGPPIEDYDVRWRVHGAGGAWEELEDATPSTALAATLTQLLPNTPWEVQVRAENDEGAGAWSASGVLDANVPPVFSGGATFIVAENVVEAGTVQATDPDTADRVTGYTLGGPDAGLFEITDAGALSFLVAPDFERPRGAPASPANANAYALTVTATGGSEARALVAERDYTVTVTDATEPPAAPAAPTFGPATATGVVVNWAAPANAGPPIEGYDLQYREAGTSGSFLAGPQDVVGLSAALAGLTPGTRYEVQVRAESDEGAGAWSEAATATTVVNGPPSLALPGTGSLPVDVQENVRRVRAVVATDTDVGDAVTGYTLAGPDADLFEFRDESGSNTLFFKSAPDFEDPQGGAANDSNAYEVTVAATSGDGARALSVERQLVVTVTDAPEPPAFEGPETFEVAENTADAGVVQAADPDAGDAVTGYTLGGADADLLAIGADGALAFLVPPDFETPLGGASDDSNDYAVTVTATGGADGLTAARDYTVRVTDVDNEVPGRPAPPTLVRATGTSLEITWDPPANAGPPITTYDVHYQENGAPATRVTMNDRGPATTATLTGLTPGTAYQVRVRAWNAEGNSRHGPFAVMTAVDNAAPAFGPGVPASGASLAVPENRADVAAVTATDQDAGDDVTYQLTGADAGLFDITDAGALSFLSAPDFERPRGAPVSPANANAYALTVTATSGEGDRALRAMRAWTVTVTDEEEPPDAPVAPTFSEATEEMAVVHWLEPANAGPPIQTYDVRYRPQNGGFSRERDLPAATRSLPLTGLTPGTTYEVQVKAFNAETDATGSSGWSPSGTVTTGANAPPAFTGDAAFEVDENGTDVGTVTASDPDTTPADPVTGYSVGGTDGALFSITPAGALAFIDPPDFETPRGGAADDTNTYELTVTVTSGQGARARSAARDYTVTVRDVDTEAPGAPAAPTPGSATATSLVMSWTAPDNDGPPISRYEVRYRAGSVGAWIAAPRGAGGASDTTRTSLTIRGLTPDTAWQVQVRAVNDEGVGGWSDPGTGMTAANAPPAFFGPAAFEVDENGTRAGAVQAQDPDAGDDLTGFALSGGNHALFEITDGGVLSFKDAPDFETPRGGAAGDSNTYEMTVTVTSGDGGREISAERRYRVTVRDVEEQATLTVTGYANATVAENSVWTSPAPAVSRAIGAVTWSLDAAGADTEAFTIVAATGVVSLAARDFEMPDDADDDNVYEAVVRATDADGNTATARFRVEVTDAPETVDLAVIAPPDTAVDENAAYSGTATLDGAPVGAVTWAKSGPDEALFTLRAAANGLSATLALEAQDHERPADQGGDNGYEVTVTATDADGNAAAQAITVTVRNVIEESTLTISGYANATVAENAAWTSPTPSVSRAIGAVTWSLDAAGADAEDFTIVAATGMVSLAARDFEMPDDANTDNVYEAVVRATDADGNTATASFRVEVTDEPEMANLAITGYANATVAENAPWTSAAPAADGAIGAVTWSLDAAGADAEDFTIVAATGVVSLAARDFEDAADANTDNVYEAVVRATDADGNTATADFTVEVTDAPETAALTVIAPPDTGVDENAAYSGTVTLDGVPVGAVTWSKSGDDAGLFALTAAPDGSSATLELAAQDFEAPADVGPDNVYKVTVTATDADGNADAEAIAVTVRDVIEESTLTITGYADATVAENAPWTSATPAADGAIGAVTWSLDAAGADAGEFTIAPATGVVSLAARDFENITDADGDHVYEAVVRATDADGNAATARFTVEVTDETETEDLGITGLQDATVAENTAWGPVTATLTGSPVGAVTWTKSGADEALFTLRPAANGLSATLGLAAQDFEAAADEGADHGHEVTVTASDLDRNAASISITVEVTDEEEPPEAPAPPTLGAVTATGLVATWTEPGNSGPPIGDYDVRWRVDGSGDDAWTEIEDDTASTALMAALAGLAPNTSHEVQVRAENVEGPGAWSASGTATTDPEDSQSGRNAAPAFDGAPYGFELAENADGSTTAVAVGTVTATDADQDDEVRYLIAAGNGAGKFALGRSSGALTYVGGGEDFERTATPLAAFVLTVRALDGTDATDAVVTVAVTDLDEPPGRPMALN